MQIQNLVATSPLPTLTAQEMRDEAMDLRLRANMDFEKVMDTAGEAIVTKNGIKFLHACDIVKSIFQRFGLESLAVLSELHEDDPPPTNDGTLFRIYLDRKYCDDKSIPIQMVDKFRPVKMPRKELTLAIAETYLEDFLRAKRTIAARITTDPDIQATLVLTFYNGVRPLALLKRLKEIPTTTLKATIARFQLITASEAELSLINIKKAAARKNTDRQFDHNKTARTWAKEKRHWRWRLWWNNNHHLKSAPPVKVAPREGDSTLQNIVELDHASFANCMDSIRIMPQ